MHPCGRSTLHRHVFRLHAYILLSTCVVQRFFESISRIWPTSLEWLRQNIIQSVGPQTTLHQSPSPVMYAVLIGRVLEKTDHAFNYTVLYLEQHRKNTYLSDSSTALACLFPSN